MFRLKNRRFLVEFIEQLRTVRSLMNFGRGVNRRFNLEVNESEKLVLQGNRGTSTIILFMDFG